VDQSILQFFNSSILQFFNSSLDFTVSRVDDEVDVIRHNHISNKLKGPLSPQLGYYIDDCLARLSVPKDGAPVIKVAGQELESPR
jgi:hypothetical protein